MCSSYSSGLVITQFTINDSYKSQQIFRSAGNVIYKFTVFLDLLLLYLDYFSAATTQLKSTISVFFICETSINPALLFVMGK